MNIKKFHVFCSCIKCKVEITTANLNAHYESCYVNTCVHCGEVISRKNKFCSKTCSAKFNNTRWTAEQRKKQGQTLSTNMTKPKAVITGSCVLCSTEYNTTNKRQNICNSCSNIHSTEKQKRVHAITRFCPKCGKFEFTFGRFQTESKKSFGWPEKKIVIGDYFDQSPWFTDSGWTHESLGFRDDWMAGKLFYQRKYNLVHGHARPFLLGTCL